MKPKGNCYEYLHNYSFYFYCDCIFLLKSQRASAFENCISPLAVSWKLRPDGFFAEGFVQEIADFKSGPDD